MPAEKSQFQGLNTDAPPDRLGAQLFRAENVLPASPDSVRVRPGVSLQAHYQPQSAGRVVIADAVPGDPGNGFLIVVVNSTGSSWQVDGLFAFRPPATAMATGGGTNAGETGGLIGDVILYGVVE